MSPRLNGGSPRPATSGARLVARVTDVSGEVPMIMPVLRLSVQRITLRLMGSPPEVGSLVQVELEEGEDALAMMDGEVIDGDEDARLVVRLVNLDPDLRQTILRAAARHGVGDALEPSTSYSLSSSRKPAPDGMADESPPEQVPPQTEEVSLEQALFGDTRAVPSLRVDPDDIDWATLDSKAASVLEVVDGVRSFDAILAASPVSRITTLRILQELLEHGLIGA